VEFGEAARERSLTDDWARVLGVSAVHEIVARLARTAECEWTTGHVRHALECARAAALTHRADSDALANCDCVRDLLACFSVVCVAFFVRVLFGA